MNEKREKGKPSWRTVSDSNPAVGRREVLLVGGSILFVVALFLVPLCLNEFAGISMRTAFMLTFGVVIVVPELVWIVLLALGIPREVRHSNALWRERKASGFYKTLPPVEEDDA